MAKKRLPDFVIHTDALEPGRERMPKVVKVQIVNPHPPTGFTPIFLKGTLMSPAAEDPTIGERRDLGAKGKHGRSVQRHFLRGTFDTARSRRQTQPITILSLLHPRTFNLQNFPFSQADRNSHLNNAPKLLPAFEFSRVVFPHLADERQFLWLGDSGSFLRVRQLDMLQRISVQFLIAHRHIQNPIEDLPLTADRAGGGSFIQPGLYISEPILRLEQSERLMAKTMTAG